MGDPRAMVEDYLTLALGFEAQAANAVDPRLSDELQKTARHYRFLAADVERGWQRQTAAVPHPVPELPPQAK
jgi:hypothetical protein